MFNHQNDQNDFHVEDKINFEPEIQLPATALTCLNGLKHGGTSRTLFICGENPQDFYSLLNEQFETHQPETIEDGHVVKDLAISRGICYAASAPITNASPNSTTKPRKKTPPASAPSTNSRNTNATASKRNAPISAPPKTS